MLRKVLVVGMLLLDACQVYYPARTSPPSPPCTDGRPFLATLDCSAADKKDVNGTTVCTSFKPGKVIVSYSVNSCYTEPTDGSGCSSIGVYGTTNGVEKELPNGGENLGVMEDLPATSDMVVDGGFVVSNYKEAIDPTSYERIRVEVTPVTCPYNPPSDPDQRQAVWGSPQSIVIEPR